MEAFVPVFTLVGFVVCSVGSVYLLLHLAFSIPVYWDRILHMHLNRRTDYCLGAIWWMLELGQINEAQAAIRLFFPAADDCFRKEESLKYLRNKMARKQEEEK
jgi:hypothetical protein